MKHLVSILFCLFLLALESCAQENQYMVAFEDTKAHALANAVVQEDLDEIERLVSQDSTLLGFATPVSGSNVLGLSINVEKFKSFKKLLELGADPNFINPYTKHSVLIDAIQPFSSQFEWRIDNRYAELLLGHGADPNYAVEHDFTNEKGHHIMATSPLMKASSLDLETVKLLVEHGADPHKRLGEDESTGFSIALSRRKFDIINYYIDFLGIDVHRPMRVRSEDSLFVQDYINKYMSYKEGYEGYEYKQRLIQKLKGMGVNFENYDYKLK